MPDNSCFEDILKVKWPRSLLESGHEKMPLEKRAKIFLPFAALTGHSDALDQAREIEIKESSLEVFQPE